LLLYHVVLSIDSAEWQLTPNETQFNYINVTDLQLKAEYQMFVVAVNDVGRTASDRIRVVIGMPYAQFGNFAQLILLGRRITTRTTVQET